MTVRTEKQSGTDAILKIRIEIVQSIRAASCASDLHEHLQGAIELEHAVIPPYLQALYSIKRGKNQIAAGLIRSIVIEEMLHMTIAANVLIAIGGSPDIKKPTFVPIYPGPLPMNVHAGLPIGLYPLSKPLLQYAFMAIEMPRDLSRPASSESIGYATIEEFYDAIIHKLQEFGDRIFLRNQQRQVLDNTWFPSDQLFHIADVASAVRAIKVIVSQGEGTSESPYAAAAQPPHYYRFAQIFHERRLLPDPSAGRGYAYSGAPIPFDAGGIWELKCNPTQRDYPPGSTAHVHSDRFNRIYTNLLHGLHQTFNGQPQHFPRVIGAMYELRLAANALTEIPIDYGHAAPTFEYAPDTA